MMRKMSVMMHANKLLLLAILILDQYQYLGSSPDTDIDPLFFS